MAPGYKNIYAKRDRAEEKKKAIQEREFISQEREIKSACCQKQTFSISPSKERSEEKVVSKLDVLCLSPSIEERKSVRCKK